MEGKKGKEKFKLRDGRTGRQMGLTSFPSEYHHGAVQGKTGCLGGTEC